MNNFVELYKATRKSYPELTRYEVYTITGRTLAQLGTISDLKSLNTYFDEESRATNTANKK